MNENICWFWAFVIVWLIPLILMAISGDPDPEIEYLWKDPEKFDFITIGLVGNIMLGILFIMVKFAEGTAF